MATVYTDLDERVTAALSAIDFAERLGTLQHSEASRTRKQGVHKVFVKHVTVKV